MPRLGRSGRHRKTTRFSNFITPYVLIALCMGAILTIGWSAVQYLLTPTAISTVAAVPQESFTPQYPSASISSTIIDTECSDFFDQDDAQKYYIAQGGPTEDPDDLDLNNDGRACENYPYSSRVLLTPSQDIEPNDQQS